MLVGLCYLTAIGRPITPTGVRKQLGLVAVVGLIGRSDMPLSVAGVRSLAVLYTAILSDHHY